MCLYVRDLDTHESRQLTRILKSAATVTYMRRAQVVAFSGQGMRVQEIADRLFLHEEYVRELIRRFNRGSFDALRPRQRTGRPSKYSEEEISMILELLTWRPQDLGQGYRAWSLRKLADFVVETGIVKEMSHSTLGRILQEHGASFQRTKTWKESSDPDFVSKKKRIDRLKKHPPQGWVVSFDEYGPVEVRPRGGRSWCPKGHPARIRATYRRIHGVRHYLSAYDLQDDRLLMHSYPRKRWQEVLRFFRYLRRRYPRDERLYIILDNASSHKKEEVVRWARAHKVTLVYTPTNASWLNPIESIFSGIQRFVFSNSDFADHNEIRLAMRQYSRWRNSHPSDATLKRIENHKPSFRTRH